jgi:asparagine synthetase B (glutamine-hydrolysing)
VSDPIAERWRAALLQTVAETCVGLPVLLSGGMDSTTLVVANVVLGYRPTCYSFTVGEVEHSDLRAARRVTDDLGLPLVVVDIPRTEDQLVGDVRRLIADLGTTLKTAIQCAQPISHMARRLRADGYSRATIGTGCIVLDDRRVAIIAHDEGEDAARVYRAAKHGDKDLDRGTGAMHRIARLRGIELVEPYTAEPVVSVGLAIDYAEMNRPRQKGIALRAFPEYFSVYPWWRRNRPLQVGSGLREWHDTLLASSWNLRGSRAVVAVYRDLART